MKHGQKLWTRDELILAMYLYHVIPYKKIDKKNIEIKKLSELIGRTADAVSYKLKNLASLDAELKAKGQKGMPNISNLDRQIWQEFYNNYGALAFESEKLFAKHNHTTIEELNNIHEEELLIEGKTKEVIIIARINQVYFRRYVLASYNNTCCITGIQQPELLIAGHIKPWSIDEKNRMNPKNGVTINALHDKAFETGLITITPDYKIKISSVIKNQDKSQFISDYFLKHDGQTIILPSRNLPDKDFLYYHNVERFKQ